MEFKVKISVINPMLGERIGKKEDVLDVKDGYLIDKNGYKWGHGNFQNSNDINRFFYGLSILFEDVEENKEEIEAKEGVGAMIKLKDLLEKYGEYEVNEEKLEEILVKPTLKTIWNLKLGDVCFVIDRGHVFKRIWKERSEDQATRESGDVFLTKEEAEFELERRKVETEMLRLGGTRDFLSMNRLCKYYIFYRHNSDALTVDYFEHVHDLGQIYFPSEELAQKAIEEIGEDRIKKYLFYVKGVEDKEND